MCIKYIDAQRQQSEFLGKYEGKAPAESTVAQRDGGDVNREF